MSKILPLVILLVLGLSACAETNTGTTVDKAAVALPTATPLEPVGVVSTTLRIPWMPETVKRWEADIEAASARYGLDPNLLAITTLVESGGNPKAVSPSGAIGLMQMGPGTASDIAVQRGISGFGADQLYEPATAIDFGAWYLGGLIRDFNQHDGDNDWRSTVELTAAAFNTGPGSVQRYLTGLAPLPREAERYRLWVGTMWGERNLPSSAGFDAWWAADGHKLIEAAKTYVKPDAG